jgi:tetratricopeptide (TPR) repeat protein
MERQRYLQAEMLFQRAIEIWQPDAARNSANLARTLNSLGAIRARLERYEEAEQLFQQSLGLADMDSVEALPNRAVSLSGLGLCRWGQGRLKDARAHFEQSLVITEQLGSEYDALLLSVLQQYKQLLQKMGRKEEVRRIEMRAKNVTPR